MSFSVRHCTDVYEISEDFVGVLPCDEGLTSEALLKYVKDIMVRCSMGATEMIGMAFDGASSMKNLAMLIQNRVSKHALYVHCFANCNELVFKDASSLGSIISDGQDFCENMYVFAGVSPKRILLFQNVQKEMPEVPGSVGDSNNFINDNNSSHDSKGNVTLKLKNLSRTRWTTRGAAADVIMRRYHALQETLSILSTDRSVTAECRTKSERITEKIALFFRNV